MMLVSDFDYDLPQSLIAQKPLQQRDQSRMLVLERDTGRIFHSQFKELLEFLSKGDVLVLNSSRVIPAKAWGELKGKEIEFLFLKEHKKNTWEVLCRPARKVRLGDTISFSDTLDGRVEEVEPEGKRLIRFSSKDVLSELKNIGFAPLPPYIKRKKTQSDLRVLDLERYQTVFARKEGSIAAPTAGLHFTPSFLKKIRTKGIAVTHISLDVGLATFQPVRVKRTEHHKMLEETYSIGTRTSRVINEAKKEGRKVLAAGTTVVRALESASKEGRVKAGSRSTDLFISPGYAYRVVDRLLTNFHLPKSTLLMLVAAFAGHDYIKKSYKEAIRHRYRFFSYGDCMLIL